MSNKTKAFLSNSSFALLCSASCVLGLLILLSSSIWISTLNLLYTHHLAPVIDGDCYIASIVQAAPTCLSAYIDLRSLHHITCKPPAASPSIKMGDAVAPYRIFRRSCFLIVLKRPRSGTRAASSFQGFSTSSTSVVHPVMSRLKVRGLTSRAHILTRAPGCLTR